MKMKKTKTAKAKWGKPKLIVLIRGRQEEAVLTNCKSEVVPGVAASQFNDGTCVLPGCGSECNTIYGS